MIQEKTELRVAKLYTCPSISSNELVGTPFEDMYHLPFDQSPLHFYVVRGQTTINFIGVLERYIGGRQLNQLLHVIKPEKASYGLDTDDLLRDWVNIGLPENEEMRKRHEAMGAPWQAFWRDRKMFWRLIDDAYVGQGQWNEEDSNKGVRGVIWWILKSDDTKEMIFKRLADHARVPAFYEIIQRHTRQGETPRFLSSVVGVWLLAYFCPEIRSDESLWKPRDSYSGELPGNIFSHGIQNMGTTQVGVMALRYANLFLNGRFIKAAQEYILDRLHTLDVC